MINIDVITHPEFGECVKLENAYVELLMSLDYGPRIRSYRLIGGENILFEDRGERVFQDHKAIKEYYDMGEKWFMYGGHRLWASPEIMPDTYFPDDRTVDYELLDNGVLLKQMDQVKNGLSFSMKVELEQDSSKVMIAHEIKNIGKNVKELAPWAITAMCPEGTCILEMPELFNAFLPNRNLTIWPYTDMKDERLSVGTKYITLTQNPKKFKACKIGINNKMGYATYVKDGTIFTMNHNHLEEGRYPDNNVSFETYTNGFFLEVESLGELVGVKPGESVKHEVTWRLKKAKGTLDIHDEASIDKFIIINLGAGKNVTAAQPTKMN